MLHDQGLLNWLASEKPETYEGVVFRVTREGLDPLTPSTNGGRWMPVNTDPVLYTSLEREGAIAEIAWHWSRLVPQPTRPALLHTLAVSVTKMLVITPANLTRLGAVWPDENSRDISRTQAIGTAAAFLGFDSMRVPSARSPSDNLVVVFAGKDANGLTLALQSTEMIDWRAHVRQSPD